MLGSLVRCTTVAAAALLVGCSVTTVAFDRQSERPAAVKLPAAEIAVYTSAVPPSAEYVVLGRVTALKGMEQLRGLTGPVPEAEVLALLKKKAAAEGAQALLDVEFKERHVSLRQRGEEIPPEIRALAEWGCDIIHYVEATALAIAFTTGLKPR